jgi:hypothetical protein
MAWNRVAGGATIRVMISQAFSIPVVREIRVPPADPAGDGTW